MWPGCRPRGRRGERGIVNKNGMNAGRRRARSKGLLEGCTLIEPGKAPLAAAEWRLPKARGRENAETPSPRSEGPRQVSPRIGDMLWCTTEGYLVLKRQTRVHVVTTVQHTQ